MRSPMKAPCFCPAKRSTKGPAGLSSRAAAPGWSALRGGVNGSAGGLGKGQLQGAGREPGS